MKDRDVLIYLHSLFLNEDYLDSILELENLDDILVMEEEDLKQFGNNKKSISKIIESRNKDYINNLVENINKNAVQVITILDEDYPVELQLIERPPKVIYVKGNKLNLDNIRIGVVGARKCTPYGKYIVEKFVSELANLNTTIISGMAQGIDAHAHKIALDNDTYSIGVLGTGVDLKFPSMNSKLYERMYKEGTIISEYPLGTRALPFYFPERNRIISALSHGVIVAEGKEKSGSLITARFAAEQGKEVFVAPGNINSIYSVGTNKLIRDGATPLLEIEDITTAIPGFLEAKINEQVSIEDSLSENEKLILEKIDSGLSTIDLILENVDLDIKEVSSLVTLLEMKGIISNMGVSGFQRNI